MDKSQNISWSKAWGTEPAPLPRNFCIGTTNACVYNSLDNLCLSWASPTSCQGRRQSSWTLWISKTLGRGGGRSRGIIFRCYCDVATVMFVVFTCVSFICSLVFLYCFRHTLGAWGSLLRSPCLVPAEPCSHFSSELLERAARVPLLMALTLSAFTSACISPFHLALSHFLPFFFTNRPRDPLLVWGEERSSSLRCGLWTTKPAWSYFCSSSATNLPRDYENRADHLLE